MDKKFISNATLAQQCYEQIQHDIISGSLKPGEKLKVSLIKNRLSIGQSPIREALSRLVSFGLVETEDNKGFRVAEISETEIYDIYNIFTKMENMALAMAITKGDDAWEASIVYHLHKLALIENSKKISSCDIWTERNYNFHVALISGCQSPILLDIRHKLYLKFDRYCRISYQFRKNELSVNHKDHKELAQAVLGRNIEKSQSLMASHLNGALNQVIKTLKSNLLI